MFIQFNKPQFMIKTHFYIEYIRKTDSIISQKKFKNYTASSSYFHGNLPFFSFFKITVILSIHSSIPHPFLSFESKPHKRTTE